MPSASVGIDMTAFDKAWGVVKLLPHEFNPTWPYPFGDPRHEMSDQESSEHDEAVIAPMAAKLFLGTILGFLEQGQEDYVARQLAKEGYRGVYPGTIEKGREIAIQQFQEFLGRYG